MDTLRDFFNGWAFDHIRGIVVSWAILTFVTVVSFAFSLKFGGIVSAYRTWSVAMDWLWICDTLFSAIAGVTWLRARH
jgi:hypothetical protein